MTLRGDWDKTKKEAAARNNGKAVVFAEKRDLGPKLDEFEAAEKAYQKADRVKDPKGWAAAATAWITTARDAGVICQQYAKDLPGMTTVNAQARSWLDSALTTLLVTSLGRPLKERDRIKALIERGG